MINSNNNRGKELISYILRSVFKPKEKAKALTWIPKSVRLSPKSGNRPGLYNLNHTPFFSQILEDVDNPRINKIVLMKSAQIGASILCSSIILYYVCTASVPIGYFMPTQEKAQEFCERALAPSIELCKEIKPFLTGNPDDIKKREFLFKNTIVRVIGAGSASKLSSNSFGVVFCDEIGKYKDFAAQGETNALALAEARAESYGKDKKIFVFSTPTCETTCQIYRQYLLGSQSKYFLPCPHCDFRQELVFNQIQWDSEGCKNDDGEYDLDKVLATAYYECISCKAAISNQAKIEMVRKGEWRATNTKPYPDELRSYHISNLYSLNHTFGNIAVRFLLAGRDPSLLQDFYNNVLGLPFEQRAATLKKEDIEAIIAISPKFQKGQLIEKPDVILMSTDTQGESFWYLVEALYPNGTASIVDWGEAQTFEDLKVIYRRTYPILGTQDSVGIYKSLIDMGGNRTEQVKEFCLKSANTFIPIIGRNESQGLYAPIRETTFQFKNYKLPGLIINDHTFKSMFYINRIKEKGLLFFPQNADDELKIQLTQEHLVQQKNKKGQLETYWKSGRRNHLGDLGKYLEAFRYYLEPKLKERREAAAQMEQARKEAAVRPPIQQPAYAGNEWG
jgi:phage terminase large subunit GpA-like protein